MKKIKALKRQLSAKEKVKYVGIFLIHLVSFGLAVFFWNVPIITFRENNSIITAILSNPVNIYFLFVAPFVNFIPNVIYREKGFLAARAFMWIHSFTPLIFYPIVLIITF